MVDPELIQASRERIPDEWRRKYLQRPADRLAADVVRLYDENFLLKRESYRIQKELLKTKKQLEFARWQLWTLWVLLLGEGAVIGWLVKIIFSLLSRH